MADSIILSSTRVRRFLYILQEAIEIAQ